MREVKTRSAFKQDIKRERKGRFRIDIEAELWNIIDKLADDIPLDASYGIIRFMVTGKVRGIAT